MNHLLILISAAITIIIGDTDILTLDKRPSVEDINKQIDNVAFKATAADCDEAWEALKVKAEDEAEALLDKQNEINQLQTQVDNLKAGGDDPDIVEGESRQVTLLKNIRYSGKRWIKDTTPTLPDHVLAYLPEGSFAEIEADADNT